MLKWIKTHKLVTFILFLIISISLVISSSSMIAAWAIRDFLRDHASDIELSKVELSLWNSDITIEGLSASDLYGKKLTFDRIYLDWDSGELWDNRLVINQLRVDGFELDIDLENLTPSQIGPIVLSQFSDNSPETEVESQSVKPESENWAVSFGDIKITDTKLCAFDSVMDFHSIGLDFNENGNINACFRLGELRIKESVELSRSQALTFRGDIAFEELLVSVINGNDLIGLNELVLKGIEFDKNLLIETVELTNLSLLSNSTQDIADYGIQIEQLQLKQAKFDPSSGTGSMKDFLLSNTNAYLRASNQAIHSALLLDEFRLTSVEKETNSLAVSGIEFSGLSLLENFKSPGDENSHLIKLEEIQLTELAHSAEKLELGEVVVGGLGAYLVSETKKNSEGAEDEQVSNLTDWVASAPSAKQESLKDELEQTSTEESISIVLNKFQLGKNSQIQFTESSLGKAITHKLNDIQIEIGAWSSKQKEVTPINYQLNIGDSGKLSGEGEFNIAQDSPVVDIKGNIKGMNLVEFSHFASRFIGYRIEQGQLNLDYSVKVSDNQIDATFDSKLIKFELGDLEEHEESELNEDLGVPLPMALNLLRDSDNNIELDFPVTGDLSSPDFSIASVISTVSVKAIKNAVLYHYSPLGMLSIASGVFDLATALNFEPVTFEKRSIALSSEAKAQLDKVVKIMNEKPKISMVICGVAVKADLPENKVNTESGAGESADKMEQKKPDIDIQPLLTLARQRQERVIEYIHTNGKIEKERLLGCNVKLDDSSKALPKVNLSL